MQLQAGLGGLRGKDIREILERIKVNLKLLNTQKLNLTIATTCNCHGVINFYKNY